MPDPAAPQRATGPARDGRRTATGPAVRAAAVTVDPLLAEHLAGLHRGVRTVVLTRLPGTSEGTLRDTDALLVLAGQPAADGSTTRSTTVYVGADPADDCVWERAVSLRAEHVVVLPAPDAEALLRCWLAEYLDDGAA